MTTRTQAVAAEIAIALRARIPLIWIVTREEARTEQYLFEAAAAANFIPRSWDCGQGITKLTAAGYVPATEINTYTPGGQSAYQSTVPDDVLDVIKGRSQRGAEGERGLWILRDFAGWVPSNPLGFTTQRKLRNLANLLPTTARECAQSVVILTPQAEVPAELAPHAKVIQWPLPDRDEVGEILDASLSALGDGIAKEVRDELAVNGKREAAIDAAVGLTADEAATCYATSLVKSKRIDPIAVAGDKKSIITRERVLEWYDPIPGGLDAVGGLDNLKEWLLARKEAFSPAAREYGVPAPRGTFVVGQSGCGKSLFAKAAATNWGVPLLRVDLGALKSKYVGESEQNLRKTFAVIETVDRCVVWFDEIEKSLAGAVQGGADGGVSADALGGLLTWMQERKGRAFVIATANDVSKLPPEFLRKGRWDELWFVDLPTPSERVAVLQAALVVHKRGGLFSNEQLASVVGATEKFTGAELAALVPDALYAGFAAKREITVDDLLASAATVVPLAKTAAEKVEALQKWAEGRARPASKPHVEAAPRKQTKGRALDL